MRHLVVDASVVLKWIFPDRRGERDVLRALDILEGIRSGEILPAQPPHWLTEVAAVCCRLDTSIAKAAVASLHEMDLPVIDTISCYDRACELSHELNHHLFDTLYHAVALTLSGTTLVTADALYYRKARKRGGITLLANYHPA